MTDAEKYEQAMPDRKQPLYPIAFDPWNREKVVVRLVFPDGSTIDLRPHNIAFERWLRKAMRG